MKEYIEIAIAMSAALIAGGWTMVKLAIKTREVLETRLDEMKSELDELKASMVTHTEMTQVMRDIEDRNDRNYQRLDIKIDSIKSDMMWLMQAMGKEHGDR